MTRRSNSHRWLVRAATRSLGVLALGAGALSAQPGPLLHCVHPAMKNGECVVQLETIDAEVTVLVRFARADGTPIRGMTVTVERNRGYAPDTVFTDARGFAAIPWRDTSVTTEVRLELLARERQDVSARQVILKPRPKVARSDWTLGPLHQNDSLVWYVERQLPEPIAVQISGPASADECATAFVRFKNLTDGGGQAPDSARGVYRAADSKRPGCWAEAHWRLGKEAGRQVLRAELSGAPAQQRQFRATARSLPRLVGGLAFSWASKFDEVRSSSQTLRVTRMENGVEIAYDSAVSSGRVDRSGNWRFAPILGLDWAPWLPIEKLRMVVGVSPLNARNEWVAGVSLTQVLSGLQRETVGVDLHLVSHWLRPEVVRDAAACRGPTADCGTTRQSLRPIGVGLMLSVDGTTLLKELVTAFPFGG